MVNSSRFASDPRIDKPWGSTLREKLPRSVHLRYINWGSMERQQWTTETSWPKRILGLPSTLIKLSLCGTSFMKLTESIRERLMNWNKDSRAWKRRRPNFKNNCSLPKPVSTRIVLGSLWLLFVKSLKCLSLHRSIKWTWLAGSCSPSNCEHGWSSRRRGVE